MTVANADDRDTFTGNGAQKVFAFSFRCTEDAHVTVYVNDVPVLSGFKVKRNLNGVGGTITFTVAPADGAEGLILRLSDLLQNNSLGVNEALNTKTLETMIDKLHIIAMQFNADLLSAVRFAKSVNLDLVSAELPIPEASMLLGWNPEATALRNVSPVEAFNELVPEGGFNGDVFGPGSSTANALATFANTTGKTLQAGAAPVTNGHLLTVLDGAWVAAPPAETADVTAASGTLWLGFDESHMPAGYELCNGQSVTINGSPYTTPDTRGKYLLAASLDDTGSAGFTGAGVEPGAIDGDKTHTHTQQGTFVSTNSNPGSNAAFNTPNTGIPINFKTNASLNHGHSVTISGATAANTEDSRPISVAVIVAIKVDE